MNLNKSQTETLENNKVTKESLVDHLFDEVEVRVSLNTVDVE